MGATVTVLKCDCGAIVPPQARHCVECEEDVGYPNVRAANSIEEVTALRVRNNDAFDSARASGYEMDLMAFGHAMRSSKAVIARSMETLLVISQSNSMLVGYHHQVASGGRLPANNHWDKGRTSAENSVHPNYFEEIQYCALSLDDVGVRAWGDCHIVLRDTHVAKRASVFEENVFQFCETKGVLSGKEAPSGYRASWEDRDKLAQAKLHHRLVKHPPPNEYNGILIDQGTGTSDAEFIEVHIYGGLHVAAFEKVTVVPGEDTDRHLIRLITKRLQAAGVQVEVA